MHIVLDVHGGVPAYRQIVDQVRFLIAAGHLTAGAALPSTRTLGQQLGINPMTVSKAYGLLEAEGIVEHRPGLPLAVRAQPPDVIAATRESELRARLAPAARAARQLGYSADAAARVLRDLLEDGPSPDTTP
jgi:GntR family transcriptional regulator